MRWSTDNMQDGLIVLIVVVSMLALLIFYDQYRLYRFRDPSVLEPHEYMPSR